MPNSAGELSAWAKKVMVRNIRSRDDLDHAFRTLPPHVCRTAPCHQGLVAKHQLGHLQRPPESAALPGRVQRHWHRVIGLDAAVEFRLPELFDVRLYATIPPRPRVAVFRHRTGQVGVLQVPDLLRRVLKIHRGSPSLRI